MIENSLSMLAGNNIWQSIAIFLIVGLIFKIIKATSAEERSWSWTATLFGLALLPLATFMPGEGITPSIFKVQNEVAQTEILTSHTVADYQPVIVILQDPPAVIQAPQTEEINILPWLLSLWGAGTALGLILLSRAAYNAYLIRINAMPYQNKPSNWPKGLEISISDEIKGPMVIGIIKPLVLIPTKFTKEMEEHLLNPLLFHELAHIKRHDNILYFIERLILTFYWWNPLMHIIANRISEERELACDDRAALSCGDQITYAKSLLMGAKNIIGRDRAVLGLAAYRIKSPLGKRIMRLTDATAFTALNLKSLGRNISILLMAIISLGLLTPRFSIESANAAAQEVEEIEFDEKEIEFNQKEIAQIKKDVRIALKEAFNEIDIEKIKADVKLALKDFPSDEEMVQIKADLKEVLIDLPSMIDVEELKITIDETLKNIEINVDSELIQQQVQEALANIEIDKEQMAKDIEEALKSLPTEEELAKMKEDMKKQLTNLKVAREEMKIELEKMKDNKENLK